MYIHYNPNPRGLRVGDCAVRAASKAAGETWGSTYAALCALGYDCGDMPNANHVWGRYLHERGFTRHALPDTCPICYTVADFCREHPRGVYVLGIGDHVVCAVDGDWYDAWDSSAEIPAYYWEREDRCMAYGYPQYYPQIPYYNAQQTAMPDQLAQLRAAQQPMMQQPAQPSNNGLIWVQGEAGRRATLSQTVRACC